jgi:tetratricopeptide (TPR) repeat protein
MRRGYKSGAYALLLLTTAAFQHGCGDKPNAKTGAAGETAGGEATGAAAGAQGAGAAAGTDGGKQSAKPSNLFGSPDADTGKPLPPRKELSGSAKSSFDDGVRAGAAGDNAGARAAFEAAVKADSGAYQALYALGVLADREGKESSAVDYYRRALRAQPDDAASARGIVVIYTRNNAIDKALAFIKPLAEQWERSTALQAVYADTLVSANRVDDAIQVARKALKRDERYVPAMLSLVKANQRAGKVELADSILDQALAVDTNVAQLHYLKGKRLLEDQRLAEALAEFRKAVELDGDFAEARMELGLRLLAGANYAEALSQFQAVERLAPRLVEVQLALGDAYRSTRQWNNAKTALDKALRTKSNILPEAHFELALLYMTAGAEFPGPDLLTGLAKAKEEFGTYRSQMGPRLTRDDASTGYLDDIDKAVAREQKRIERDKKAAERAARGTAAPAPAGGTK